MIIRTQPYVQDSEVEAEYCEKNWNLPLPGMVRISFGIYETFKEIFKEETTVALGYGSAVRVYGVVLPEAGQSDTQPGSTP